MDHLLRHYYHAYVEHYLFHNESGSIYKCFKESQGMSAYMAGMLEDWTKDLPEGTTITIGEY